MLFRLAFGLGGVVSIFSEKANFLVRVREKMPDEAPVYEVSELFKVFGDSTRARIICALNIEEMCVRSGGRCWG